jgi:hypothetical protein
MRNCNRQTRAGELAERIRALWTRRTRLHEDFDEEGVGLRTDSGKQEALTKILAREARVVVYGREVKLVEHLGGLSVGRKRIGSAHALDEPRNNIARFQRHEFDALAMTRALGLRGLDFPEAGAMVLFSAKRDWKAMDQEMCRIRGQRRHSPRKPVYVLCYSRTYETMKLDDVVESLTRIKDGKHARYVVEREAEAKFTRVRAKKQAGARTSKKVTGSVKAR